MNFLKHDGLHLEPRVLVGASVCSVGRRHCKLGCAPVGEGNEGQATARGVCVCLNITSHITMRNCSDLCHRQHCAVNQPAWLAAWLRGQAVLYNNVTVHRFLPPSLTVRLQDVPCCDSCCKEIHLE